MSPDFKKEIFRKSIHASGIFFLPLIFWDKFVFSGLFLFFLGIYFLTEFLSKRKIRIPLLTSVTQFSKRHDEQAHLAHGAIFLSLSCILLPLIFPEKIAALALAQVFVADSAAALIGMKWGKKKIYPSSSKSWAGTGAYLSSAFFISLLWASPLDALELALLGSVLEMIPTKNADNLFIPWGIAILASFYR